MSSKLPTAMTTWLTLPAASRLTSATVTLFHQPFETAKPASLVRSTNCLFSWAKTRTGIQQWNILCRWAFCLSLKQQSPPTPVELPADSNVEMTWQVFGGEAHELYLALLKERCERDGLGSSDEVLARQFRLHLHRGIGYLATPHAVKSINDLVRLAFAEPLADEPPDQGA